MSQPGVPGKGNADVNIELDITFLLVSLLLLFTTSQH